jgi:hypothetical protein
MLCLVPPHGHSVALILLAAISRCIGLFRHADQLNSQLTHRSRRSNLGGCHMQCREENHLMTRRGLS